jgi:hypothetical protein
MTNKDTKFKNLMQEVNKKLHNGEYIYVSHANARLQEREITRMEVKYVLRNGYHEAKKDKFNIDKNCWNYSIRGKTLDKKGLRVVVSFDKRNMLIITVIDLDK